MSVAVSGLTVTLGATTALDGIDLDIDTGILAAVVGPNGAGKSTLLRALAGDITPADGTIRFNGETLDGRSPRERARIRSFLAQGNPQTIDFPVRDVVAFGQFASDDPAQTVVDAAMQRVDVTTLADRSYAELSGGEQRRVSIARVLAQQAAAVLMDEPTDSLDLGHADMVMQSTADEARAGHTVIVSSHDLNVAARHADVVVLLDNGRIVATGTPTEVLTAERLSPVYQARVHVLLHPRTALPVIFL